MKNFFKGISLSSIAAGALAAVTSFLLSAKIGIAGSVIGVAIGSIVSAVSSQIYQNVLHESGRKLQDVAGTTGDEDDGATETAADTGYNRFHRRQCAGPYSVHRQSGGAAGPRITRARSRSADRRLGRRTAAVARR